MGTCGRTRWKISGLVRVCCFFFQAEDGIRDADVTGVQTCALPILIRTLEGNGYLAQEFISALTVATFMLLPIAYMLLPLYVSLVGGDLVAKEAEDGTRSEERRVGKECRSRWSTYH